MSFVLLRSQSQKSTINKIKLLKLSDDIGMISFAILIVENVISDFNR